MDVSKDLIFIERFASAIGAILFVNDSKLKRFKFSRWSFALNLICIISFVFLVFNLRYFFSEYKITGIVSFVGTWQIVAYTVFNVSEFLLQIFKRQSIKDILNETYGISKYEKKLSCFILSYPFLLFLHCSCGLSIHLMFGVQQINFSSITGIILSHIRIWQMSFSSLYNIFLLEILTNQIQLTNRVEDCKEFFSHYDKVLVVASRILKLFSLHLIIKLFILVEAITINLYQVILFFIYNEVYQNTNVLLPLYLAFIDLELITILIQCYKIGNFFITVSSHQLIGSSLIFLLKS